MKTYYTIFLTLIYLITQLILANSTIYSLNVMIVVNTFICAIMSWKIFSLHEKPKK